MASIKGIPTNLSYRKPQIVLAKLRIYDGWNWCIFGKSYLEFEILKVFCLYVSWFIEMDYSRDNIFSWTYNHEGK